MLQRTGTAKQQCVSWARRDLFRLWILSECAHTEFADPGAAEGVQFATLRPWCVGQKRGALLIVTRDDGLGLGLALSRQTMLDHGGDLWLASGPGESATFRLRLPLTLKAGNP